MGIKEVVLVGNTDEIGTEDNVVANENEKHAT